MISALKITAERMAEVGECRCMMSIVFSHGKVPAKSAGMIAKYFATSLAMEKVVKAPRVTNNCLPDGAGGRMMQLVIRDVEHSTEVTAEILYGAIATALAVLQRGQLGRRDRRGIHNRDCCCPATARET